MKLVLGTVVGLSPGEFVLDGDPAPPPKGQSPVSNFKVEVQNFEIGPEVGALPVIASKTFCAPLAQGSKILTRDLSSAYKCL